MRLFPRLSLNRLLRASVPSEGTEQLFLAPPFTPAIAASVGLIATRVTYRADESSRLLCQREANGMCALEYEALEPLFTRIPRPKRVLEVGPGFGRSVVYFGKKGVWEDGAEIDLYDADGSQTKYKQLHYDRPPKWPDLSSFCGNLGLLKTFLDYNGVTGYRVFNAAELPLAKLPGPYDLVYGFFSIGFHWSLEFYLDDLAPLLGEQTVLVCTLNKHFKPFAALDGFSTRILYCKDVKKSSAPLRLLALSRSPLPLKAGVSIEEAFPGHRS